MIPAKEALLVNPICIQAEKMNQAELLCLLESLSPNESTSFKITTSITEAELGKIIHSLRENNNHSIELWRKGAGLNFGKIYLVSSNSSIEKGYSETELPADPFVNSVQFQHNFVERLPNNVYIVDMKKMEIEYINELVANTLDYTKEEIYTWGPEFLQKSMASDYVDDAIHNFERLSQLEDGMVNYFEYKMKTRSGRTIWISSKETVLERDLDGNVWRIIGISSEITDYKALIEKHKSNEKRLEILMNNLPVVTYTAEPNEHFTPKTISKNLIDVLGYDAKLFINNNRWEDIVHPDDKEILFKEELPSALQREFTEVEFRMKHMLGHYIWIKKRARVIRDENGQAIEIIGMIEDVTIRKIAMKQLVQMKEKLDLALDAGNIGIWKWDLQTMEFECDAKHDQILGFKPENEHRRYEHFLSRLIPEDKEFLLNHSKAYFSHLNDDSIFFTYLREPDDKPIYIWSQSKIQRDENGKPIYSIGTIVDLTELKKAQDAIKESELKFKAIFNQSFQFIGLLTPDGILKEINESALESVGVSADAVLNKPFWKTPFWNRSITAQNRIRHMIKEAAKGRFMRSEEIQKSDSKNPIFVDFSISPIFDENGKVIFLIPEGRPITELKEAEMKIKRMNESLEEMVKIRTESLRLTNQELESFNYSVSHDLRTPIRGINTYSSLLLRACGDSLSSEGKQFLKAITDNAKTMSHLIDDLLSYSRLGRTQFNPGRLQMKELVLNQFNQLKVLEPKRQIELNVQNAPDAYGDLNLVTQLLNNVINNAIKYTGKNKLTLIEFGGIEKGNMVEYFIRDNGIGFEQKYANKIFGVFERLHGTEFEGTGVGLAIVQRVLDRHGGKVSVESAPNKGTTFYFTLPKTLTHVTEFVL